MTEPAKALADRLATAKSDLERQAWWRDRVCGDPKTPWLDELAWWVHAAVTILAVLRSTPPVAPTFTRQEREDVAWLCDKAARAPGPSSPYFSELGDKVRALPTIPGGPTPLIATSPATDRGDPCGTCGCSHRAGFYNHNFVSRAQRAKLKAEA